MKEFRNTHLYYFDQLGFIQDPGDNFVHTLLLFMSKALQKWVNPNSPIIRNGNP